MNDTLRTWWSTGLTAALAALYGWLGLAAHGLDRALGLGGAVLVLAAVPVARRSRALAVTLLVAGAVPLAVAAWWSIAAPLVGLLILLLGWTAVRTGPAPTAPPNP
ncbi:hypothetical protein [Streptomyces sp. NPDC047000]|uniref:hypothetical protein n=1 Tax=Streptomyces sp. NPDC047000 TaxID=3155474 RepID=UPI0034035C2D